SAPRVASSSALCSSKSPSTKLKFGCRLACSRKRRCPVEKLSIPDTDQPDCSNRSHRELPMNPPQPVTKALINSSAAAGFARSREHPVAKEQVSGERGDYHSNPHSPMRRKIEHLDARGHHRDSHEIVDHGD